MDRSTQTKLTTKAFMRRDVLIVQVRGLVAGLHCASLLIVHGFIAIANNISINEIIFCNPMVWVHNASIDTTTGRQNVKLAIHPS